MNQYPFPPVPYMSPVVDPRAFAMAQPNAAGRSAALWQWVLGGLIFLTGTCALFAVWLVPAQVILDAVRQQQVELPRVENMTPEQELRVAMTVGMGLMMVVGAILIALGFFVRRGGIVSTVLSMLVVGLIGLLMGLNFVGALFQLASQPMAIVQMAILGGILALVVVTLVKLIGVVRVGGSSQQMAMLQAQAWMMQQRGAYGGGYGYGGVSSTPGQEQMGWSGQQPMPMPPGMQAPPPPPGPGQMPPPPPPV